MKKKEEVVIPVVEETARIVKRSVERGVVRVSKIVRESEEVLDTSGVEEELDIQRVARDEWLDAPVPVRTEGDTTIIPVMEEVTVVEKRLRLVEEVHIRRKRVEKKGKTKVRVRKEEVTVERKKS